MGSDGRKNNGGARKGAGRKSKVDELAFLERLDNIIDSDEAIKKLKQLIEDDNFHALKLFLEYRFGKPKETIETTHIVNEDLSEEDIVRITEQLRGIY